MSTKITKAVDGNSKNFVNIKSNFTANCKQKWGLTKLEYFLWKKVVQRHAFIPTWNLHCSQMKSTNIKTRTAMKKKLLVVNLWKKCHKQCTYEIFDIHHYEQEIREAYPKIYSFVMLQFLCNFVHFYMTNQTEGLRCTGCQALSDSNPFSED